MKEVADVCPLLSHEVHASLIRREFNLSRLSQRSSGIEIVAVGFWFWFSFLLFGRLRLGCLTCPLRRYEMSR